MKSSHTKVRLTLFFLFLLQGCTSNRSFLSTKNIDNWDLTGKIGIAYPSENCQNNYCPPHSEQGKLKWQQRETTYKLEISDPFGRLVIEIIGNDQSLLAKIPGKKPINTTPSEFAALIAGNSKQKAILATLTQRDLKYWVTGRPLPNLQYEKKSDNEFIQKGFNIRSRQWRQTSAGNMPALIVVKKAKFQIRIVVKEWLAPTE